MDQRKIHAAALGDLMTDADELGSQLNHWQLALYADTLIAKAGLHDGIFDNFRFILIISHRIAGRIDRVGKALLRPCAFHLTHLTTVFYNIDIIL